MLRSKDFRKVMPLLMALRAYGRDFDAAAVLVERIWEAAPADTSDRPNGGAGSNGETASMPSVPFEDKLEYVAGLLAEINKRVIKVLWLRPSWKKKRWLPVLVWVREEHFANTKAIELSMANVYFLRFAEAARKMVGNTKQLRNHPQPLRNVAPLEKEGSNKEAMRYEKCLAELLGHLVIRKRWNWRKMRLERTQYHSREVLKLGKVLMDGLDETTKLWLVNYFEEQLKLFVRMFPGVFGAPPAPDGGADEASAPKSHKDKGIFPNGQGWIAILEDVALQGAYGDFEKVCDTEAVTIWLFLEHQKIKAAAAE